MLTRHNSDPLGYNSPPTATTPQMCDPPPPAPPPTAAAAARGGQFGAQQQQRATATAAAVALQATTGQIRAMVQEYVRGSSGGVGCYVSVQLTPLPDRQRPGGYNRSCAHQYVGKYQSCMVTTDLIDVRVGAGWAMSAAGYVPSIHSEIRLVPVTDITSDTTLAATMVVGPATV